MELSFVSPFVAIASRDIVPSSLDMQKLYMRAMVGQNVLPSMWADRRKLHAITFKVDEIELQIINDMADSLGVDKSEAIRRAILSLFIISDPRLKVGDALKLPLPDNSSLWDALKPFPELSNHLGIELRAWRRKTGNG